MTQKLESQANEILTSHKGFSKQRKSFGFSSYRKPIRFSKNKKFKYNGKALDSKNERNDYFDTSPYRYIFGYKILDSRMRWTPIIKEIMRFKQEGTILDIGCAYGFLLKFLPNSFEK